MYYERSYSGDTYTEYGYDDYLVWEDELSDEEFKALTRGDEGEEITQEELDANF